MIKIQKISLHAKKKHYYSISFEADDGTTGSADVHEDVLVAMGLRKGLELEDEAFQQIVAAEKRYEAYRAALRYLGVRMRTVAETESYLRQKGYQPPDIRYAIERLLKEKLLDDRAFAQMFVRSRMRTTTKGPALISRELEQKGISRSDREAALAEYTFEAQLENARKFAEKKRAASPRLSAAEEKRRIAAALAQRGFDRDVISDVMGNWPERDEETEWQALIAQAGKIAAKTREADERKRRYKIKAQLYRKGFSPDLIERYLNGFEE